MRIRTQLSNERQGATTVEMSLAVLPAFVLVFAIFEFSYYEMRRQLQISASREGARLAVVGGDQFSKDDIESHIKQKLVGHGTDTIAVSIYQSDTKGNKMGEWESTTEGDLIAVEVETSYVPLVSNWGLMPESVPINTRAIMYREVN